MKKKAIKVIEPRPIRPPGEPGAWLRYRGLWSPVQQEFDEERWPVIVAPTENEKDPLVFYEGKFYKVELTVEAKAALNEPWLELARSLGRAEAKKEIAFMEEFNALCPMPKSEVRAHLERLLAKHDMRQSCDELMVSVETAGDPFGGFR
jgi:hypothetical protein